MNAEYRSLTIKDLDLLVTCGGDLYHEIVQLGEWSPATFGWRLTSMLEAGLAHVIGAFTEDGTFAGAICWRQAPALFSAEKIAHELFWFVLPRFRGRGIGRALLDRLEPWCDQEQLVLVMPAPAPRRGLAKTYLAHGYKEVETAFARQPNVQEKEELSCRE